MTKKPKIFLEKRDCFVYPPSIYYYSPHIHYPEYPFSNDTLASEANEVYDMVRSSLYGLELDVDHYGLRNWNPLGDYEGKKILLKPNWVKHFNPIGGLDCTVTHPSIIRCMIDYCVIAKASVIMIGDAPVNNTNLDMLLEVHGYSRLFHFYQEQNINIIVKDFRMFKSENFQPGSPMSKKKYMSDEQTIEFDMGKISEFADLYDKKFKIIGYVDKKTNELHNKNTHKYLFTKEVINADLIINLPKPKTHRFAGITGALKNFIGTCPDKEYLPHYRKGTPENGGDENNYLNIFGNLYTFCYEQLYKAHDAENYFFEKIFEFFRGKFDFVNSWLLRHIYHKSQYFHGQWYGNDTIWRTVLDIYVLLLYADIGGGIKFDSPPKNILTIGDMIIAGEKSGPLEPSQKPLGIILASNNCVLFDYVFCMITGFDYKRIPTIKNTIQNPLLLTESIDKILITSNNTEYNNKPIGDVSFPKTWSFTPHPYWEEVLKI